MLKRNPSLDRESVGNTSHGAPSTVDDENSIAYLLNSARPPEVDTSSMVTLPPPAVGASIFTQDDSEVEMYPQTSLVDEVDEPYPRHSLVEFEQLEAVVQEGLYSVM